MIFRCSGKKSIFAMTAHIVFNSIDSKNCVTHSKKQFNILEIILVLKI